MSQTTVASELPWAGANVRCLAAVNVVAAAVLILASNRSGATASLSHQLHWLDVAVLALMVASVADGMWLAQFRRAVIARRVVAVPDVAPVAASRDGVAAPTDSGRREWLYLPGTTRVHHAGCALIAGKPARQISLESTRARRLELRPCEVCGE